MVAALRYSAQVRCPKARVAEKLSFQQVCRDRAAMHRHQCAAGTGRGGVDRARHQFLASASSAQHHHRQGRGRDAADHGHGSWALDGLRLRQAVERGGPDSLHSEASATSEMIREGNGQSVLLVEDDDSVRLLVRDVLEDLGYRTFESAEPTYACEMLRSGKHFDLRVSAIGLPAMNGRQLAEIASDHHPDLPILVVTDYAENAAIRAGFLGRNIAMITKPFQIEVLSAKISEMLGEN